MSGDEDLPVDAPKTHRYLARFESVLRSRSSYKRFQLRTGAPYWSLWSVGEYTFAPYKVAWREMSGGRFAAAWFGTHDDDVLGRKLIVPDHKVYFVALESPDEAAYLVGVLNSPLVSAAVSAYAAQLSLGVSVVEYLRIPRFDPDDPRHADLAATARSITEAGGTAADGELRHLDELVAALMDVPPAVAAAMEADTHGG